MTTKEKEFTSCIHGLIFQTCTLCKDKSIENVKQEVEQVRANRIKKSVYETQAVFEAKETDIDRDYDIDMG